MKFTKEDGTADRHAIEDFVLQHLENPLAPNWAMLAVGYLLYNRLAKISGDLDLIEENINTIKDMLEARDLAGQ